MFLIWAGLTPPIPPMIVLKDGETQVADTTFRDYKLQLHYSYTTPTRHYTTLRYTTLIILHCTTTTLQLQLH